MATEVSGTPSYLVWWLDLIIELATVSIIHVQKIVKQEAFEKCWAHSLLRAVLHCHSPGVATAATVARRLRIDDHDDNA